MIPFDGYRPCCHLSALEAMAAFCTECGGPLLRCMNFADCRSLVAPLDPCPVCLDPSLRPADGARMSGGVGSRLSIPLALANAPTSVRPLHVLRVQKVERDRPPVDVPIAFDAVDPGRSREFLVEAGPFDADGMTAVELVLTLASRSREGFTEAYVWSGTLMIDVARDRQEGVKIDVSGVKDTGIVNIPIYGGPQRAEAAAVAALEPIRLHRNERRERDGVRGEAGVLVPRNVEVAFAGFPDGDAPKFPVGFGAKRALAFGRAGRRTAADVVPMDVSLRVHRADGTLDEEASTRISRHHFDLMVENARLVLVARSMKGTLVDGRRIAPGAAEPVGDGALIVPAEDVAGRIGLRVRFDADRQGLVRRIELRREP